MDIKDLKTLIKMVTETDITEFDMENADEKIVIKRGRGQEVIHVTSPQNYSPQTQMMAPQAAAVPSAAPAPPVAPAAVVNDKHETITSSIVGTFYASPSPDSPAYVKVGDVVEVGQSFCIVEAMKLMNEIEAEFKCRIVEILKANAQPVEFGDPLFLVERL
ncbi:biotin carboxyl carrier protein [Desulfuromonas soudanensis]|uniref:Biotin carboxyl carrier protein of acetyl-CoA carboxylase n=1 Tax=Desulfuromonas soudanensis TaxID=1603606 RepID=A0A0M4CXF5_9BACT|nr:acetyl-CoA carboxylase biotin carboxyl carrier protein [Desulfuromonas soudanensis]ALC16904.1 biotin carboxyl carrier protein [Desulfuromonas soudanensis]